MPYHHVPHFAASGLAETATTDSETKEDALSQSNFQSPPPFATRKAPIPAQFKPSQGSKETFDYASFSRELTRRLQEYIDSLPKTTFEQRSGDGQLVLPRCRKSFGAPEILQMRSSVSYKSKDRCNWMKDEHTSKETKKRPASTLSLEPVASNNIQRRASVAIMIPSEKESQRNPDTTAQRSSIPNEVDKGIFRALFTKNNRPDWTESDERERPTSRLSRAFRRLSISL